MLSLNGEQPRNEAHNKVSRIKNLGTLELNMKKRRLSLQTNYSSSHHPLSHIKRYQPNGLNNEVITNRNEEVMKDIVEHFKKLHEEGIFKKNYHHFKERKKLSDMNNEKFLNPSIPLNGLKHWAFLREQFQKQKHRVVFREQSEVRDVL